MVPGRGQAGHHQGGAGPEVRGHDRRALELAAAPDHGQVAVHGDVRPQALSSLTCMKRFSKMVSVITRGAPGHAHQGHELGLHVRGEAGVGTGADVHAGEGAPGVHGDAAVSALRRTPASVNLPMTAVRWGTGAFTRVTSPLVMAAAAR